MKNRVIAVGFFDGVHLGHKALMDKAVAVSKEKNLSSAVFTFNNHPDNIVFNQNIPLIVSDSMREHDILTHGNVDEVFFWDFNKKTAAMPWDKFVSDILVSELGAKHIITGEDFIFGHKGEGNAQKLLDFCKQNNIGYDAINKVFLDDIRISSTYIRSLIEKGEIEQANRFLGHPYAISGYIEKGRQVGRTIGIPTINLSMPQNMQRFPLGAYITRVTIGGISYMATTNVGMMPTFLDSTNIKIESHIIGFNQDVYGKFATVEFLKFLRPEKKFASIEELRAEIFKNIKQTKDYFEGGVL